MTHPAQPSAEALPTAGDDIDKVLRHGLADELPDQGFTSRVMAALPPARLASGPAPARRQRGLLLAGALLGGAGAAWSLAGPGLQQMAQAAGDAALGQPMAPALALAWLICLGTAVVLAWSLLQEPR